MAGNVQLFVNVDSNGNIIADDSGKNIVATESFDYFFITDEGVADNAGLYKVVIGDNMKPQLVLKE